MESIKVPSGKRAEWGILISLFLLGLAFRLPHLARCSLWLDETWRVTIAEGPFKSFTEDPIGLFNQILSDAGLERLILTLFGHAEWSVRITAAVAGALAVPATYTLGRIVFNRSPAIMGALLLCLSPLHITYSQEAASYALAGLMTVLFLIALALPPGELTRRRFCFAVAAATAMATAHIYLLLFVVIVLCLYIVANRSARFTTAALSCLGAVIVLSLPSLISHLAWAHNGPLKGPQMDTGIKMYPVRIINSYLAGPLTENFGAIFQRDFYAPELRQDAGLLSKAAAWTALLAVLTIAPFRAIAAAARNKHMAVWILTLALYLAFLSWQQVFTHQSFVRYAVPVLPVFFIILASAASGVFKVQRVIGTLVLAIVLVNFQLVANGDPPGRKWKPNARSIAERIRHDSATKTGVCLIIPDKFEVPLYDFYLEKSQCTILRQPAFERYFYGDRRDQYYPTPEQDTVENHWFADHLISNNNGFAKVYIVSQRQKTRADEIAELLRPSFMRVERTQVDGILVIVLERRRP